jgi:hypothetical protein
MPYAVNERVLLKGRRLRFIVTEPDAARFAAVDDTDPNPAALETTFAILNEAGVEQQVKIERPCRPERLKRWFRWVPLSYGELDTGGVEQGMYALHTWIGPKDHTALLARSRFAVFGEEYYADFISETAEERLVRKTPFKDEAEVTQALRDSWEEVFSYLSIPAVRHIVFQISGLGLSRRTLEAAAVEPFKWTMFHVNRFIFDQLFYGGVLRVYAIDDRKFHLGFELKAPILSLSEELPKELYQLVDSLREDEYRVQLKWSARDEDGVLEVVWS